MTEDKERPKSNWRVGIVPAIACGAFVYVVEQILYRQGEEEGVDVAEAMYDFGTRVVKRIIESKY